MEVNMDKRMKKLGVHIPEILLPVGGTDLSKWAVIACDQYTSQPEYWENVRNEVGDSPSTFHLIFPEIYLKDEDIEERIAHINKTMEQYLEQRILESQGAGFVLVERSTPKTPSRKGLILALDLECYDYMPGSRTLIRATEGTVLERIPPRVKIRENAPIELPHIMVLIDDPEKTVIERLYANARAGMYRKLYDFELMQGGGYIKGWMVSDEESIAMAAQALEALMDVDGSNDAGDGSQKVHTSGNTSQQACSGMLFAVGDGNHSLASAKAHWENVKASLFKSGAARPASAGVASADNQSAQEDKDAVPDHPARYALVEIVNVHDDGLVFEPIHRVLFNTDPATITEKLKQACKGQLCADFRLYGSREEMERATAGLMERAVIKDSIGPEEKTASGRKEAAPGKMAHLIPYVLEGRYGIMVVENPVSNIEVAALQGILDELLKNDPSIGIDYIHGDEVVTELGSKPGVMGFYLPAMNKRDLFPAVKHDGVLPRKTFSMGEAEEKRYYLECRRIR
jgi:hypothetical protein